MLVSLGTENNQCYAFSLLDQHLLNGCGLDEEHALLLSPVVPPKQTGIIMLLEEKAPAVDIIVQ